MVDDTKVPEAPVTDTKSEATGVESTIVNKRASIENAIIEENNTVPELEQVETASDDKKEVTTTETTPDSETSTDDPIERMKKSVQKRIDKVIAKSKSVEEELAETKAELERLRKNPVTESVVDAKNDTPPTIEQIEAYIIKMREEGNVKEEIAATRYLIKVEKDLAIKEVTEIQSKTQKEVQDREAKINSDMKDLANDYVVYDDKGEPEAHNDLTLSNQKGLLFKTAKALYDDKDLHKDFYNDPNIVNGFRRAVADAYREIHQQGLLKAPKGNIIAPEKKNIRMTLADPSTDSSEESPSQSSVHVPLSDAEKVREEIKARNKNRQVRR
jgi:hypothetical protein